MIRFNDIHAIKLIARACEVDFVPVLHHCIAEYDGNDRLKGGVLFTGYRSGSVSIHMAGFCKNWVSRPMVYLAFDYPFRQLGVKKLYGMVPERNPKALKNDVHLGFKIEYLTRDVYNYEDGVNGVYLLSMYRDDCRWLKMKMPTITYAPPERTNPLPRNPLTDVPTVGMMQ